MQNNVDINKVTLVTGGARRIGAQICRTLHANGMNVMIHHNASRHEAEELSDHLNAVREGSAAAVQTNLADTDSLDQLVEATCSQFGRLDGLVNNASRFYPTPVGTVSAENWQDIMSTNLKAPFFLSQSAAPELSKTNGAIINIADIYAERPLGDHPVYSIAKAGLVMLTRSLARELAPAIRVNAVSPGAILWPESKPGASEREALLARIPAGRLGRPQDIAEAVHFLLSHGDYVTGQVLTIDGGRSVMA